MASTFFGPPFIFGNAPPKPLTGFPSGKTRLRIRGDDFVKARVRTSDGIREFVVIEENGHWVPGVELARNLDKA